MTARYFRIVLEKESTGSTITRMRQFARGVPNPKELLNKEFADLIDAGWKPYPVEVDCVEWFRLQKGEPEICGRF